MNALGVQTREAQDARLRPYHALAMDSLVRLIERDNDESAREEWQARYGHAYPVYAGIAGQEILFEH